MRPEEPKKYFFGDGAPPLSQVLDDQPHPPPRLSEGLDPPMPWANWKKIGQCIPLCQQNTPFHHYWLCKIFSRFFRSLGRAPWNSFSNFSWKKIPCTFYAPWCKKWCLISAFTMQTSGFTSLINYWRIISLWTESASSVGVHEIGEWGEKVCYDFRQCCFSI